MKNYVLIGKDVEHYGSFYDFGLGYVETDCDEQVLLKDLDCFDYRP